MKRCAGLLALMLASCAPGHAKPEMEVLARPPWVLLPGIYSNAEQRDLVPETLSRVPVAGNTDPWLDTQVARFYMINAPRLGGEAIYLEWSAGEDAGPISRQRIWVFRPGPDGNTVMDFYTLKSPELFAGKGEEPGAFETIGPSDLIGYGDSCALTQETPQAETYVFRIPTTCVITSRSGRRMSLEAQVVITPDGVDYREAGRLEGGGTAFQVPGVGSYEFRK
jgi:hypothetical protein